MKPEGRQITTDHAVLQLWFAWPSDLSDAGAEAACAVLLSDEEKARAAKFHFERHRREYLATHALARTALSHAHPLPPHAWTYSVNAYGKPAPVPECGLRFNQSSSVELAVCLIAPTGVGTGAEVGVDVESFSRAEEIVPLATKVFSRAEQEQLNALPAAERPHRALSLWTLKEAYIKARGMGLSLPLHGISFLFGGAQGIHLEVDAGVDGDPARWRFCLLDYVEHRIAVVVDAAAAGNLEIDDIEIFEARPPFAPPARLPSGSETWFPLLASPWRSHAVG